MTEFSYKKTQVEKIHRPEIKKRVLVLYTGGTIGMIYSEKGLIPFPIEEIIRKFPMLNDFDYEFSNEERKSFPYPPISMPLTFNKFLIQYCVVSYDPLLDSSNMNMDDWGRIAEDIGRYYKDFDGFVVLHGTDTMCYTASALSFMLEHLGKPVIITGAQVPLLELRSDGRDNILDSLIVAGEYVIPEVCILFNSKLFRGNRCTKVDSSRMDAFNSPGLPPLATLEIDIKVAWDSIHRNTELVSFTVEKNMNQNVGILRLFPGITPQTVRSFLQPPMEGVILLSFGAGNVPDRNEALLAELKAATDKGLIILNCSQCARGHVNDKYAAGRILLSKGVILGGDMTAEAALAKLSYVLAKKEMTLEKKKEMLQRNIRGELTTLVEDKPTEGPTTTGFLRLLAQTVGLTSEKEVANMKTYLLPQLMCSAAAKGDIDTLLELKKQGGDFSLPDYDNRTPLHIACCQGHFDTVKLLLSHGASVHIKDRFGHTPLIDAIKFKHFDIINLLVQTGAHIQTETNFYIVSELCQAALKDDVEALKAWKVAQANLSMTDYNGKTALDLARSQKSTKAIRYLTNILSSAGQ